MREYYNLTKQLYSQLTSQQINIVQIGDIAMVDLDKQGIYPLAHILVNQANININTIDFEISIIFADTVDFNNSNDKDGTPFFGNDNKQDVLNAMLAEANVISQSLMRGTLLENHYEVLVPPTAEPFTERFQNELTGWVLDFTVAVPNTNICA